MVRYGTVIGILGAVMAAQAAAAEPGQGVEAGGPEVFVNHGDLVLSEDGKMTKFITPRILMENGRFQVRIKRPVAEPKQEAELPAVEVSLTDRIEARRIMHDANQAFFDGEIAKTWDLVARAESLDPTYFRIKTMKGSLLFKIGSTDLALEVWRDSLAQNPDQPEILQVIKSIEAGGGARREVARGVPADENKASLQ